MAELSQSVLRAPRSGIRKIMELAQTMDGVIHLEVGEPLFATPEHIVEAGCAALRAGYTKYTPNAGMRELREAIAESRTKELGVRVEPENVLVGIGGVEVINCAFRAFCEPGDEVLIPDPAWPNYRMMATIANVKPVPYSLRAENRFYPVTEELEKLVTERTKLLVVNSPSNPLGVVFPEKVMRELLEFAGRHDLYLLSDEAYERIVYDTDMVTPYAMDTEKKVIAAHTLSKTYAMTGWRIGYLLADSGIIQTMMKLQEAYISSVPGANQMAGVAAIRGPQKCVEEMRRTYQDNRDLAAALFAEAGISYFLPGGAFYMWVGIEGKDSTEFAEKLLLKEKVAVAPGQTFGENGEGWLRISLASKGEDLQEGIKRLVHFYNLQ
ncbi:MAG: aminotransferase class I/II-fold pyridoxal phosphate-dependent enzyme [Lachnospiraceae bacterium]|nr:aminotransferase class I/II-fold pyridoxal phosphate-dependent enzyme [Lachnospiraceae bacterium]